MINAMWSYNNGSRSGRALAYALGVRLIKKVGSRFRWNARKTIINWGSAVLPTVQVLPRILNNQDSVAVARNKLRTFRELQRQGRVNIPEFTTSPQEARGWLRTGSVCVRYTTTGHEGKGLEIVSQGDYEAFDRMRVAPLYTKYVKKRSEWRVHVVLGEAVHVQQKVRTRDAPEAGDRRIRNTANGYVFTSNRVSPGDVARQGVWAVQDLGLDFGAVDVVWNEHHQQAAVLEVNTAPGIEGITVEKYAQALRGV